MSEIITLNNATLSLGISCLGAELVYVRAADGEELLWYGDPKWWEGHAPLLFPICSSLKNGRYTHNGVSYALPQHGFGKTSEFTLVEKTDDRAVFLLTDSAETRKVYPFAFRLTVEYVLVGAAVDVTYRVENMGDETLYYSIGAHEGFSLPEGVDAYEIVFDKTETLASCVLDGPILSHDAAPIMENARTLRLKEEYFEVDALIFEKLESRALTLRRHSGGRAFRVEFPDFDHLLIWQPMGAPFVCVEPWTGMPDYTDVSGVLAEKPYITALPARAAKQHFHRCIFAEAE